MTKNTRFSPEVRQRAVRMVLESQGEYDSQWAAICSIAPKIGCTPETLRVWVRQHERDTGSGDGGLTTAERQRLKELERENRELRRSNDILRQASAYFAKAEFDRLWKKCATLDSSSSTGSDRYAANSYCPVNVLPLSATATSSG
ncbi:transposase [Escherichia coli]|uniref:transposase n=1 Tax=Escherichia coli TaxID=562 RepID=UPI0021FE7AB6|nr:transposase [Escherichia coli]